MLMLALDTAGPNCAVCIYDAQAGEIIASLSDNIGRGHAEHLPIIVQRIMDENRLGFDAIKRLAVTEGPGSFAGIRVGVSYARALALVLNIPAIGVSSLRAMAIEVSDNHKTPTLAIMDARRGEFYIAGVDVNGDTLIAPSAIKIDQIEGYLSQEDWLLCGSGTALLPESERCKTRIIHESASPSIEWVAKIGAMNKELTSLPKPEYLRAADAKISDSFALSRL